MFMVKLRYQIETHNVIIFMSLFEFVFSISSLSLKKKNRIMMRIRMMIMNGITLCDCYHRYHIRVSRLGEKNIPLQR